MRKRKIKYWQGMKVMNQKTDINLAISVYIRILKQQLFWYKYLFEPSCLAKLAFDKSFKNETWQKLYNHFSDNVLLWMVDILPLVG